MFRRLKKQEGFTLVELMVVIMIIGILVAIAVPMYNKSHAQAQEKACQANLRIINGAISQYLVVKGKTATEATELNGTLDDDHPLITEGFLQSPPKSPVAKAYYTIENAKAVCPDTPQHTLP